jgi:hypothetical protein
MTLQFFVNNQNLSLNPAQRDVKIASNSKNYLKARFTHILKQTSPLKSFNNLTDTSPRFSGAFVFALTVSLGL